MSIISKPINCDLFTNFNNITYFDEPHEYLINDEKFVSVTTLIHKYVNEFDEEYWSKIKSEQYGVPQYKIKRAWKFINKKGTLKGSIIHDYAENKLLNKVFKYPKELIYNEFGFDPIFSEYTITKKHVDQFIKDSKDKLIIIKTELVVYDLEYRVAGMVDALFFNVTKGVYQIWDHKTNKALTLSNPNYQMNGILSILDNSDLDIYSLQLSMYKHIIEKNTSLILGDSYIVWYSHNNDNYKIYKTKNYDYYVKEILNERKLEIKG